MQAVSQNVQSVVDTLGERGYVRGVTEGRHMDTRTQLKNINVAHRLADEASRTLRTLFLVEERRNGLDMADSADSDIAAPERRLVAALAKVRSVRAARAEMDASKRAAAV